MDGARFSPGRRLRSLKPPERPVRPNGMRKLALITILTLAVPACLGSDFANSVEGAWQMTSGEIDGQPIEPPETHPITITFEEDEVSGTASCNGFGGTFSVNGSSISISNLAMTEMACSPEETMEAEAMFSDAITRVDTVSVDGTLTLSADGVEMVFEKLDPVPEAELTDTRWILDGLIQGDKIASPVAGSEAFIDLWSDGSVTGDTGCRPFSGQYIIEGAEVHMTEMTADGHECEPNFADQDNLFFSVVGDGFRVEIDGNRLTMSSRGAEGLTFVARG